MCDRKASARRGWIGIILLVVAAVTAGSGWAQEDAFLSVSTFFGGSGMDGWADVPLIEAADGTFYAAGNTRSSNLPIPIGAYDTSYNGGWDLFVVHLNSALTEVLHATYVGGSSADAGWPGVDLMLDGDGSVYLASTSNSTNYPVTIGAYSTTHPGGYDLVVTKLSADLSEIEASTYLGGSGTEDFPKLSLHPSGDILVTSCTTSSNFPTTAGAYRTTLRGGKDLAIARFSPDLVTLVSATYLGSSGNDWPETIVPSGSDELYLTGWTASVSFPTTENAFLTNGSGGMYQTFISCMSADLTTLVASTYIGGNNWEFGYDLVLDEAGNVYACGHTASTNFPGTESGAQSSYSGSGGAGNGDDMWVARLSHDLSTLQAATYLGGTGWENAVELVLIPEGIIVGGTTSSSNWPVTPDAFSTDPTAGNSIFTKTICLTRLDRDLTTIEASTYLGGIGNDSLGSLTLTANGRITIGASTNSADFPVNPAAFDASYSGGNFEYGGDLLLAIIDAGLTGAGPTPVNLPSPTGQIQLQGAIPNPLNPRTEVAFSISEPGRVKLAVLDLAGRHVATLAHRNFEAGEHRVPWSGVDRTGRAVASGTYIVQVSSGRENKSLKLLLTK